MTQVIDTTGDSLPTAEDMAAMEKAQQAIKDEIAEKAEQSKNALEFAQKYLSEAASSELQSYLKESYFYDFKIVDSPIGTRQADDAAWGDTFINQVNGGGITGDECSGTFCIPLLNGQYLQFNYSV